MTRRGTPLEELYFQWLIQPLDKKWDETFDINLLKTMFRTRFEHFVPNDVNRALDGIELRQEFLYKRPVRSSKWEIDGWLAEDCSILEMLLALADRCEYRTGILKTEWFSTFLRNLGLADHYSPSKTRRVLQRLNKRTYSRDGLGGLFPLENPLEDQREVEIWYQMMAYIIENSEGMEV